MQSLRPDRRKFLQGTMAVGTGTMLGSTMFQQVEAAINIGDGPPVTEGDRAILRFLAAAELVEEDLWQQYCELAVGNRRYQRALKRIDRSLIRYICDDRDDERSHAALINAFLISIGDDPVSLDDFRVLEGSYARGADQNVLRVTNLSNLVVDTSWFNRYRGIGNPDFGDEFDQLVFIDGQDTIPTGNPMSKLEFQIAAHSAAFHFAAIEQGGGSLYSSLIGKITNPAVLQILASIGPTEIYHFSAFHKSLEGIFRIPKSHINFPNLRRDRNLSEAIFPEPCTFIDENLPLCSVIRPTSTANAGAVAAATGLVQSGLFNGQSEDFFNAVTSLAIDADAASRQF